MGKIYIKRLLICAYAIILAFINVANAQNLRTYANNSVLSNGKTVKIRVQKEGFYTLSYDKLRKMGFSNPKNVHLRGYGGELLDENFTKDNHYIDDLPDQPVVDLGDKIAFYLRGVEGLTKTNAIETDNIGFSENYASDYSYYFLHEENSEAKRIEYAKALEENDVKKTTFTAISWLKYDELNIAKSGRNWYGIKLSDGEGQSLTFNFNNLVVGDTAHFFSNVMSASPDSAAFLLSTDSTNAIKKLGRLSKNVYGDDGTISTKVFQSSSDKLTATFYYVTSSNSGTGYIDYIIAAAKCHLRGDLDYLMIPVAPSDSEKSITYAALNSNSNMQVWDVTEIDNIRRIPTRSSKDSLIFTVKSRQTVGRYIMVNTNGNFNNPGDAGVVEPQNLHALKNIEYVVVSNPEFIKQAKQVAEFHKEKDGMSTVVVTSDQVYNEFSSGTPDPTAIRAFMKMLWDKANASEYGVYPQYLLLMGDGTYDNIGRIKGNDFNKIVTYQSINSLNESNSYTCDDYFGYVEDNSLGYDLLYKNDPLNIGVGRFPVYKEKQAEILVNKLKHYYESEGGDWQTKIIALADDDESNPLRSSYHTFLEHQEEAIKTIEAADPRMNTSRIYWDSYTCDMSGGSRRYPDLTEDITKKFSEGVLMFNYLGHGSFNAISAEHSYTIPQVQSIYNKVYPLWFAGSCNVSQFDDLTPSFGEEIILNPNGGAIASIGSVRIAYSSSNRDLDKDFMKEMFNPENEFRLGKIYRAAKTARLYDSNKLRYTLLGDPGLRLRIPELNIVIDSTMIIQSDGTTVIADTLKALSKVKFSCHVEDDRGTLLRQFNGKVDIVFKDKQMQIYTKGNKTQFYEPEQFGYLERKSTLFSGSTNITNGKFEIQMIIPKDINYKIGYGRLSMYGYDEQNGWDATGANDSLLVGGSIPNLETDNVGPNIVLSINGEKYRDGYITNPTPMIYIKLSDKNGINATNNSIGHNITITIDDDTKNVISLNSYFKYDMSSCTSGNADYHIETPLSEGWHTIKVKAWDFYSNSSESTIRIYVKDKIAPEIETFTVYPNPAKDILTVFIKTNRPEEVHTAECMLKDFSGRQIAKKILTDKSTDGTWKIEWNLHENGKIDPGLYLLHSKIATDESNFAEKAEKIVVIAQ